MVSETIRPGRQLTNELHRIGTPVEVNFLIVDYCAASAERCRRMVEYLTKNPNLPEEQYVREALRLEKMIPLTPEEEEDDRVPEEE